MKGPPSALPALYDGWWNEARPFAASGEVRIDPYLADPKQREADRRRGLTLIVRPDAPTSCFLAEKLAPLRDAEPDQYFYAPEELHVTFLSLFSAEASYRPPADFPAYLAAVRKALRDIPRFEIALRGLTATRDAVLVQGFPEDDGLNRARDLFRARFAEAGLAGTLDRRYRATSSHLTALRFRQPLRDPGALARRLEEMRAIPLGRIAVGAVVLVENDWYHAADRVTVLASIPLA